MMPIREYSYGRGMRPGRRTDRGSTVLLVVTILSLLVLLAIALTFTSRMELGASRNYTIGVQNRVAALTGVEAMAAQMALSLDPGPIGPLQLAASWEPVVPASGIMPAGAPRARSVTPVHRSATAEGLVLDASARLNINTASEDMLEAFFAAFAAETGRSLNAAAIARSIVAWRLGPDGAPGRLGTDDDLGSTSALWSAAAGSRSLDAIIQARLDGVRDDPMTVARADRDKRQELRRALVTGVDTPSEYIADIRLPAFGDDRRFASIGDLARLPVVRAAGINEDVVELLSPYLTVFSVSEDVLPTRGGEVLPLVDINRASATEIFDALVALYGSTKNERLLRQFAVNIVDARDANSIPTVFPGTEGADAILGVERTPFITEIYPDSLTPNDEGDDGQFIEIHNPWSEDIDITGWKLRGPSGSWTLVGKIPGGGFLIYTDDIDDSGDPLDKHVAGTGSLYDVFGILPDGRLRQAMADPTFQIPSDLRRQTWELLDRDSNLIDVFTFTPDPLDVDSFMSWQRENPLVRHAVRKRATPFAVPARTETPEAGVLTRIGALPPDGPFVSVVDVMGVFAGFTDPAVDASRQWAFPEIVSPASHSETDRQLAARPDVLDARLIDAFSVGFHAPPAGLAQNRRRQSSEPRESALVPFEAGPRVALLENRGRERSVLAQAGLRPDLAEVRALAEVLYYEPSVGIRHGRVNLNTAGELVLSALPGLDAASARRLVDRRAALVRAAMETGEGDGILYRRPSDVLVDDLLWGTQMGVGERVRASRQLLAHVGFNSRAFLLVGQPRLDATSDGDHQKATRVETLVSIDRGTAEPLFTRAAGSNR